jgi:hypothetical protein
MVLQSWKYLGSKLGRLFKKKKERKLSCCPRFNWTEPRTRLTGPTSDRSVPDTTRLFYLQPLEGKKSSLNKNIGSQRWNKTFPERIVHRWTVDGTLDESPRHPPTSKTREGPRIFFKCVQMSFDFKLAFFFFMKSFSNNSQQMFFPSLRIVWHWCPLLFYILSGVEWRKTKEYGRLGFFCLFITTIPAFVSFYICLVSVWSPGCFPSSL